MVNAMRAGITVRGITQSISVHPALPEVVQRAFGELDWRLGRDLSSPHLWGEFDRELLVSTFLTGTAR